MQAIQMRKRASWPGWSRCGVGVSLKVHVFALAGSLSSSEPKSVLDGDTERRLDDGVTSAADLALASGWGLGIELD